jgi:hypothetical protein
MRNVSDLTVSLAFSSTSIPFTDLLAGFWEVVVSLNMKYKKEAKKNGGAVFQQYFPGKHYYSIQDQSGLEAIRTGNKKLPKR